MTCMICHGHFDDSFGTDFQWCGRSDRIDCFVCIAHVGIFAVVYNNHFQLEIVVPNYFGIVGMASITLIVNAIL